MDGLSDLPAHSSLNNDAGRGWSRMKEIWKDIFGFNGKYQINNFGEIKSQLKEELKQRTTKDGYKTVTLYDSGYRKTIAVHRLVALHFIPNPGLLDQVNHIDGDKTNNRVDNLEWCTQVENANHAVRLGLFHEHNARPIIGTDKNGNKVRFKSAAEAERKLSINSSSICSVCTKHNPYRHTAGGYIWEYTN